MDGQKFTFILFDDARLDNRSILIAHVCLRSIVRPEEHVFLGKVAVSKNWDKNPYRSISHALVTAVQEDLTMRAVSRDIFLRFIE